MFYSHMSTEAVVRTRLTSGVVSLWAVLTQLRGRRREHEVRGSEAKRSEKEWDERRRRGVSGFNSSYKEKER